MKTKKGFTLVELIVVITILAILGTIAFLSYQGYSSNSRDSVRTTDIGTTKTSLELFATKTGNYPLPENYQTISYSGGAVWHEGELGEETIKIIGNVNKTPKDPLTNTKYTYSITSTNKTEYELAVVYEGNITQNTNKLLVKESYAEGNVNGTTKITGNYNQINLTTSTGGETYNLFSPSIIGDGSSINFVEILTNNKLVLNGSKKLPKSYKNSNFKEGNINLQITKILLSTGSLTELKGKSNESKNKRKEYLKNMQEILSGSLLESNYKEIVELNIDDNNEINQSNIDILALNVLNGKWKPTTIIAKETAPNSCATQPNYTNATFEIGTPTTFNQEWQSSNNSNACYWTCGAGKVLLGNDCVNENCSGTTPDGTSKITNATSTAGGTWNYNTIPGVCTYSCNTGYHTEDAGVTCVEDTRNCSITNGSGSQTWNSGTNTWNTCNVTSCDSGYTQSGNSCVLANSCATPTPSGGNYGTTTVGSPISPNQPWTYSSTPGNCTYSCNNGYTGSGCSNVCGSYSSSIVLNTGYRPENITSDIYGNIFISHSSNTVIKINSSGISNTLGTTGSSPDGIVTDGSGNVYTANWSSNNVTKITPSGTSTILGTTGTNPGAITIDNLGNIYTANNNSSNVTKLTPSGVKTTLGTTGITPQFITSDISRNIYVSNWSSGNITKFNSSGVKSTISLNNSLGAGPKGIVTDISGNLYVATSWNNVLKITPSGIQSVFGTTSPDPNGITIDNYGNIYTANYSSNNVTKITPSGVSTTIGTTGNGPYNVTVDSNGNIYTNNWGSYDITKFSINSCN